MNEHAGGDDRSAMGTVLASPPTARIGRSRIVIGIQDLGFHQEVLDWLDRDFRVEVVGAAGDPERLAQLLAKDGADVALVCPSMARQLLHPSAKAKLPRTFLVAQEMTVPVLREAIDMGAHGVFAWPEERDELSSEVTRADASRASASAHRGLVVAVLGSRGGAGTTFLVSHLAAAFAHRGTRCALVDLEAGFDDMTVALGLRPEERPRTIADLLPVIDELSPDHVLDALHGHPMGFAALLAPPEAGQQAVLARLYAAAIALLAVEFQAVVLHLPRGESEAVRRAAELADEVLLVVTLDLLSLHGARRAISTLRLGEGRAATRVVVNRLARAEVTPRDVERVLGMPPWSAIQLDPAVKRAQDRGELLPSRSRRAGRDVGKLCRNLAEAQAAAHSQEGS